MKRGFTLLELIVVIIIIGVLASLALPRLFSVIEKSRTAEAMVAIATIRSAMERCYLMSDGTYYPCKTAQVLGIEDPAKSPNAHFNYRVVTSLGNPEMYAIYAYRNLLDGGDKLAMLPIGDLFVQTAYAIPEPMPEYNLIGLGLCNGEIIKCGKNFYESFGSCSAMCLLAPSLDYSSF